MYLNYILKKYLNSFFVNEIESIRYKKTISNSFSNLNIDLISLSNGYTLIRLIIVVVFIGILSSFSIPLFTNLTEKARQAEAAIHIKSYIKAAKAYNNEYGSSARNAGDLSNYVDVIECRMHMRTWCKDTTNKNTQRNMGKIFPMSPQWNSPSGYFTINMRDSNTNIFLIRATPQTQKWQRSNILSDKGYGVSGCYNYLTGNARIKLWDKPGYKNVVNIQC